MQRLLRALVALVVSLPIWLGCAEESVSATPEPPPLVNPAPVAVPQPVPGPAVVADAAVDAGPDASTDASVEVIFDAGLDDPSVTPQSVGGKKKGQPKKKPVRIRPRKFGCSFPQDGIRRVVHRHINEVKYCYEHGLMKNHALEGIVAVKFTIGLTGSVTKSKVTKSTLGNQAVEQCIAQAVRRWTFPQPCGEKIVVTYPFQLKP